MYVENSVEKCIVVMIISQNPVFYYSIGDNFYNIKEVVVFLG